MRHLDKLTIAAINGCAIHSGMSPALSRDFRIAATYFLRGTPFVEKHFRG